MNARHHVLFTSWYVGLGGGEVDLLTLAAAAPADVRAHLLLPREGQLAQRWRAMGLPVHILPFRGATTWFIPALWSRFPVVARLAELLQRERIALVHSDYHTLPFVAGACRRTGVPLAWHCEGWWFAPKPYQRAFFRHLPVVARSKSVQAGFLGHPPFMPTDAMPIMTIGVDTARLHPALDKHSLREELGIAAETPLVAMVARFQHVKGHETFQQMARLVAQELPQARFIVAGEETFGVAGDVAYRDKVLAAAQADPLLRDTLRYIGFRADVERVYAAADVVVCASDFESFGRVNVEAMACGVSVVSTDVGGTRETVQDGITGFLVPPRQPAALAERVLRLLRDPALRAKMGQAARQHVLAHFDQAETTRRYWAYLTALLPRD